MATERAARSWACAVLLGAMATFPFALLASPALRPRLVRLRRADLLWAVAATLLVIVSIASGSLMGETTFAIAFLAFKGGEALASPRAAPAAGVCLRRAFVLAFGALLTWSLAQVLLGNAQRASGPSWFLHPNTFASALLIVGFAAMQGVAPRLRWLAAASVLAGLVLTGSRAGLLGYSVALVLVGLFDARWRRVTLASLGTAVAAVAVVSVAFPGRTWAQRLLSPAYSAIGVERTAKNLLVWTEEMDDPTFWNQLGVRTARGSSGGGRPAVWTISRVQPVEWARPQQAVLLSRGKTYTLSVTLRADQGLRPGVMGWSDDARGRAHFEAALAGGEQGDVLLADGLEAVVARVVALEGGWSRLDLTFALAGTGTVTVGVGVSPGLGSSTLGDAVEAKALQLEEGSAATAYEPAIRRTTGVGEALARGRIYEVAWQGIREAPLLGQGGRPFAAFYAARYSDTPTPGHAHNAFLQVAFATGVLGLAAFLIALAALFLAGGPLQKALLLGMAVANVFDSTLTTGSVFYLLAFVVPASSALGGTEPAGR